MFPLKRLSNSIFLWIPLVSFSILTPCIVYGLEPAPGRVAYDSKGRRDPFEPLVSDEAPRSIDGLKGVQTVDDLKVQGVVVDRDRGSYVVVNGVVLAEGAEEDGVKAVRIEEGGALFQIRGREQFKKFSVIEPEEESD